MISRNIVRYIHTNVQCWSVAKSQLATLRKKTGYTFSNCKKALEIHNNDLTEAEKWLHEQAQALGWSKAMKLEGRQTKQGLIALALENRKAALIEINCETDFVAKNQNFHEMAESAAQACLRYFKIQPHSNDQLTKLYLNEEQLRNLPSNKGKTLADELALLIGSVRENATLRRAVCVTANNDILLSGYAHPSGTARNNILLGRLGGLVALRRKEQKDIDINELGKNLSLHVVGMNPKQIGSLDQSSENAEEETSLIHQDYVIDESIKISELLEENGVEIIDFLRYECGEITPDDSKSC